MSFTSRTVVATYLRNDLSPCSGTVTASLSCDISDGVRDVPTTSIIATLDGSGSVSWVLLANDDPTTQPVGSYYEFKEQIVGSSLNVRRAVIPSAGSGNVQLLEIAPTTTTPDRKSVV